MKTKVIFLIDQEPEFKEVFAYFPFEPDFDNKGNKASYMHVGQHSACSPDYAKGCKLATPEQYEDLKQELESIGYDLEILNTAN